MKILKDILKSYLFPDRIKQAYGDKVRESINKNSIDWEQRAIESSKSLIAAICFKESATTLAEKTENLIFPPIGYYYSLFHLSVGLLKMDYSIELTELRNIHHKTLINLVETKLIQPGIISRDFLKHINTLKELRENCNYKFGFTEDLAKALHNADKLTEDCFDKGLIFLHQILEITNTRYRFQVSIGDHFGDDIIDTYLSGDDKERVWNYLSINSLTS